MTQKRRISLSQAIAAQAPLQLDIEDAIKDAGKPPQQQLDFAAQISVYAAKQRAKSQRKNAKPETGPTPERLAKLGERDDLRTHTPPISDKDTKALTRAHTIVAPVDKYGPSWPEQLERAARDIRNIFLIAESGAQRVTGTYDGMPGGVAGPRHGGVADHIRECQNMVELIKATFPASVIRDINWFLTQVVVKNGSGDAMKWEDAGALISPWKSEEAKKGIGYGGFHKSLEVLAMFLAQHRAQGFGAGVASPEAARALNVQMKALAQVLREKEARKARREEQRQLERKGR